MILNSASPRNLRDSEGAVCQLAHRRTFFLLAQKLEQKFHCPPPLLILLTDSQNNPNTIFMELLTEDIVLFS